MWTYRQTTGRLLRDGVPVATGYSGCNEGKNNPACQDDKNLGPIPQGVWKLTEMFDSVQHGPLCIRLEPAEGTVTFGRFGFLIHGDSATHPGEASKGCIVLPRKFREQVWESWDTELEVTE
jgi:hypothetical protein